jgi:hypothetical protein
MGQHDSLDIGARRNFSDFVRGDVLLDLTAKGAPAAPSILLRADEVIE